MFVTKVFLASLIGGGHALVNVANVTTLPGWNGTGAGQAILLAGYQQNTGKYAGPWGDVRV